MTRNWIAANLVLLVIAGLLAWQLRASIERFGVENDISRLQPIQDLKQKMGQDTGGLPAFQTPKHYGAAEFAIIPQQNLFSETRAKEEKVEAPVVQEVPQLQVKPVLVGVTISGSQRLAAIVDPSRSAGPRKSQTKRVGDTYQGYTVTDITHNQMVLEYGPRREVIPLFDNSKHGGGGGKTAIQPTRVVSFGGGGGGGAATAVAARAGAPGGPQVGTPPAKANQQAAKQQPPAAPPAPGAATTPAQPTIPGETTNDKGQRVIRTPFGDIVRPN